MQSTELDTLTMSKLVHISDKTIVNFIKQHCASYYGRELHEYQSETRKRPIVTMKKTAAYFIKKYVKSSTFLGIGALFNNLDHATILYYVRVIQELATVDKQTAKDLKAIDFEIRKFIDKMLLKMNSDEAIINFNEVHLISLGEGKEVVLKGFSEEQLADFENYLQSKARLFKDTGMYLVNTIEE